MSATLTLPDIIAQLMSRSDGDASASAADDELMLRYGRGDSDAFLQLYRRYRDRLYRFVVRFAGSATETDEICQEVWMAIVRSRERYRPDASFATYLFSIAHRQAIECYRKRPSDEKELFADDYSNEDAPDKELFAIQASDALTRAVSSLPLAQREAFLMRVEGHLHVGQIALATGATKETAKSRLRYAYRRLRSALEEWR
jgi:RNA polymerase sigma-70 factor (ECF subfamily)